MELLEEISANLQAGKAKIVREKVQEAIDAGIPAADILNNGLMAGMNVIGQKFKNQNILLNTLLLFLT